MKRLKGRHIVLAAVGVVVAVIAILMIDQHAGYQSARRNAVQDRQRALYGASAFHVLTFVQVDEPDALTDMLRELYRVSEGEWIYAGEALFTTPSDQIGPIDWSGVVMVQYESREAFDSERARPEYEAAISAFPNLYEIGMKRSPIGNLAFPQLLLGIKIGTAFSSDPSPYPFTPAFTGDARPEAGQPLFDSGGMSTIDALRNAGEAGRDAAVLVNLNKAGTSEEVEQDQQYGLSMLSLMAELGYGPIHQGTAISLHDGHEFDDISLVYYPGTEFFADMITSTFYQGIVVDKTLADFQSTATVPLLNAIAGE